MSDVERSVSEQTVSDRFDVISVHGARENNLKDVTISIPKRRLTVFTGVSGSGKSSLVFDTIAAESRRLLNETYSTFVQGFMPTVARPNVDLLEGLTMAIVVDQQRLGGDPRSTVGTVTDALTLLRILFSRVGDPKVGPPSAFSFNLATVRASGVMTVERGGARPTRQTFSRLGGMCPRCEGRGSISDLDLSQIVDPSKSIRDGAILVPGYSRGGWNARLYAESGLVDPDKPVGSFTDEERHRLLYHEPVRMKIAGINMTYEGLIGRVQRSILSKDPGGLQPHLREFVDRVATFVTCPECEGTRLSERARSSRIAGLNIAEVSAIEIAALAEWVEALSLPEVGPLLGAIAEVLSSFLEVGLGYLTLERPTGTLSGGEAQRVKMVRHLGSSLSDVTYVFDEPTVGLHPYDIERLNGLLLRLRDKGNTVMVVEHKPSTMRVADHIVDLGPGAGSAGGKVCYEGDFEGLITSGTTTGMHLRDRLRVRDSVRTAKDYLKVRNASLHNLKEVDLDIPLGVLVAVTGVSGSGKSSLVQCALDASSGATRVDQRMIRGSRRSSTATYTGVMDHIRKLFAKVNGVKPALFSSNSEGACQSCNGLGVTYVDLAVMASVPTICEECQGRRFDASVLEWRVGGLNISEVLELTVVDAHGFFAMGEARTPRVTTVLERLIDVGLGYVTLGQPLTSLSGGEHQRLKLAVILGGDEGIYALDEPTAGLHLADIETLLALLDRLVNAGNSVFVIEHHPAVIAHADWVIDLGPGAGSHGGSIVFEGTPEALALDRSTRTGEYLAKAIAESTE